MLSQAVLSVRAHVGLILRLCNECPGQGRNQNPSESKDDCGAKCPPPAVFSLLRAREKCARQPGSESLADGQTKSNDGIMYSEQRKDAAHPALFSSSPTCGIEAKTASSASSVGQWRRSVQFVARLALEDGPEGERRRMGRIRGRIPPFLRQFYGQNVLHGRINRTS
jgi:hypothetical protein